MLVWLSLRQTEGHKGDASLAVLETDGHRDDAGLAVLETDRGT